MYKREIKFEDFNGVERVGDFYFNLTEQELNKLELSYPGGYAESLQQLVKSQDGKAIMQAFEDLILMAYGEKSPDGLYFEKSEKIAQRFKCTNAYSELFMELMNDPIKAADFMNHIIPRKMQLSEEQKENVLNEAVVTVGTEGQAN